MNIELTEDQQIFVKRAIESGRLQSEEDAVREAMLLWEERERQRLDLIASIEEAEAEIDRGEGIEVDDVRSFMEEFIQKARRGQPKPIAS
jgi:putative addiction module CopG family antidote